MIFLGLNRRATSSLNFLIARREIILEQRPLVNATASGVLRLYARRASTARCGWETDAECSPDRCGTAFYWEFQQRLNHGKLAPGPVGLAEKNSRHPPPAASNSARRQESLARPPNRRKNNNAHCAPCCMNK